jgi:AcrR family transcriptional regulator
MAGGRHDQRERGTPRTELARLRAERDEQTAAARRRIELAILEACGEAGYRAVSVQQVIERSGSNRAQFYSHYKSKAACFECAYDGLASEVVAGILGAGRGAPDWRAGLRAALGELASLVAERPVLARGLLAEVHVAGGAALARRGELLEKLAHALDSARCAPGAGQDPPPLTARFMLGAVDSAAVSALAKGAQADFPALVPELEGLIVAAYFGEGAALQDQPEGVQLRTTLPDIRKPSLNSRSPRTKK